MSRQLQSPTPPPAIPIYVLRGHSAQIHSLHFSRQNLRLLSGDAGGWVVFWDLTIKRAAAVWRAHEGSVLGVGDWGSDKIITHGRDGKLIVWQLRPDDEAQFSKVLPIDDTVTTRPKPWIVHVLTVNTLNFCAFAMCIRPPTSPTAVNSSNSNDDQPSDGTSILIATPGLQDGHIAITSLPDETRFASVPTPRDINTGMLMSVALVSHPRLSTTTTLSDPSPALAVLAGYESGHVALWTQNTSRKWQTAYTCQAHTQPVLSVASAPVHAECWYSSSADAILARHPLFPPWHDEDRLTRPTKHAGQQGLSVRSDEKILASAGWDGRVRVYSTGKLAELAVLKWHVEGCYATAFARVDGFEDGEGGKVEGTRRLTIAEQRMNKTRTQHLLAAGSKDGKISLWDIY